MRMVEWALVTLAVIVVAFIVVPWIVATIMEIRRKGDPPGGM